MVAYTQVRQFGNIGLLATFVALAALILLLAAPFGALNPNDGDAYWVGHDEADTFEVSNWGSLNLMTTGVAIALAGAATLLLVSKFKIHQNPGRVFGWMASAFMTVGAVVALISASLWVGGGMADNYSPGEEAGIDAPGAGYYPGGLTGLIQNGIFDPAAAAGDFIPLVPLFVFVAAIGLLWMGLRMNVNLAPEDKQNRVSQYNLYALLAVGVMVMAFLLPWSVQEYQAGAGDTDKIYYAAQTILSQEGTSVGTEEMWSTLGYTFNTFLIGAFVFVGAAMISGFMTLMGTRSANWLFYPTGLMALWVLSAWGASWINGWVPLKDVEGLGDSFSPAYFQFLALIPIGAILAFMFMQMAVMNENRAENDLAKIV